MHEDEESAYYSLNMCFRQYQCSISEISRLLLHARFIMKIMMHMGAFLYIPALEHNAKLLGKVLRLI